MRVGLFDIEYVGHTPNGHKWKFTNLRTTIVHHTYGTEEEVRKSAGQQTKSWNRRIKMLKLPGGALRLNGMNATPRS